MQRPSTPVAVFTIEEEEADSAQRLRQEPQPASRIKRGRHAVVDTLGLMDMHTPRLRVAADSTAADSGVRECGTPACKFPAGHIGLCQPECISGHRMHNGSSMGASTIAIAAMNPRAQHEGTTHEQLVLVYKGHDSMGMGKTALMTDCTGSCSKAPIAPMGRLLTRSPRLSLAQLWRTLRSTTARTCH